MKFQGPIYKQSHFQKCIALFVSLTLAVLLGIGQAQVAEESGSLLIAFERYSNKLRNRDTTPWIRLYDSGELLVYYPHYKREAGLYQAFIDADEIANILEALAYARLTGPDAARTAQGIRADQLAASEQGPGVSSEETIAHYRSETVVSRISSRTADALTTVELTNLQADVDRVPSVSLNRAAYAESSLMALSKHPALVWIESPSLPSSAQ